MNASPSLSFFASLRPCAFALHSGVPRSRSISRFVVLDVLFLMENAPEGG